ncbi:hypothetical protein [Curtobacterium sp. MCBD17_032]|uniref:hypothetical protein n=1 Tax=Curtobacterium sp. MCBD17_032 TaxID=2175659 RepID=UPI0011B522A8|nr:hypothetical protein [Curtobacterium sp. MCBD17_032]
MTTTAAIAQETHNPVIPVGYDIAWTISVAVVLLAIAAVTWLLVRTIARAVRRGPAPTTDREVRRPGR